MNKPPIYSRHTFSRGKVFKKVTILKLMERGIGDKNILERFAEEFARIAEKHCLYIIVSGFVAIAHGRTRATEDIDMIIPRITKKIFFEIHKDLLKNNFVCIQSDDPETMYDYLAENISVRYTYRDAPLPEMEVKFAKDILDHYQLETRMKLPLTGVDIWFSSVDMNIAFKEEYLKSDKDLEDARHLRLVYKAIINEEKINNIKKLIKKLRLKE